MEFVILSAARNLSEKITIGGSIVDSLMQVSDLFKKLSISGNFANSSVDAGSLASIKVKGLISGNPADGLDEIHAQRGPVQNPGCFVQGHD